MKTAKPASQIKRFVRLCGAHAPEYTPVFFFRHCLRGVVVVWARPGLETRFATIISNLDVATNTQPNKSLEPITAALTVSDVPGNPKVGDLSAPASGGAGSVLGR